MGRNISQALYRELANLNKDEDSKKLAMKALKTYIKELDSNAIALFLAQVSDTEETFSSSPEHRITLYEVLARVHGSKIVTQIDHIMGTVINTLKSSSEESIALSQSCLKVVSAIARYCIDPTTPINKKRGIIHSLCKPLSDSLLSNQDNLSCGASLCLKGLVDLYNWRFASNEMVNEVCQRVTGVLDKQVNTDSHMALVMTLAKHNSQIVEAYARLLIQSALRILNVLDCNSQKKVSAIKMVSFLMKYLDPKSLFSELGLVIEEMNKCRSRDQMDDVKIAALEALHMAKRIFAKRELHLSSGGGKSPRSPLTSSCESRTVDSFVGYNDSVVESPISYEQSSLNSQCCTMYNENGCNDLLLKHGDFSELNQNSEYENLFDYQGDYEDRFSDIFKETMRNGERSTTPNSQMLSSRINGDNVKINTTPRKLRYSHQDPNDTNSNFSGTHTTRFQTPISKIHQTALSYGGNYVQNKDTNLSSNVEQFSCSLESVSSTEDILAEADLEVFPKVVPGKADESQSMVFKKGFIKSHLGLFSGFFIAIFALFCWFLIVDKYDEAYILVPT